MNGVIQTMEGQPIFHAMNCAAFAEAVVVHESQTAPIPESTSGRRSYNGLWRDHRD